MSAFDLIANALANQRNIADAERSGRPDATLKAACDNFIQAKEHLDHLKQAKEPVEADIRGQAGIVRDCRIEIRRYLGGKGRPRFVYRGRCFHLDRVGVVHSNLLSTKTTTQTEA